MHRELGKWRDTAMAVAYQCLVAYALASIVYVLGSFAWGTHAETSGIVIAAVSAAILAYLLIVKDPFLQNRRKRAAEPGNGGE